MVDVGFGVNPITLMKRLHMLNVIGCVQRVIRQLRSFTFI
jgi:hypothetical protein